MAALLQMFLNVFTYFANFAILKLGARYGIRLALVVFWVAATVTLMAAINAVLNTLVTEVHPIVQTALTLLPSITGTCIGAIASCRAACWLYVSGVYVASVKARV
ncbi:hypothetical protein D3C78_470480 [compost metagenome]